jgi:hypothetical protein
MIPVQFHNGIPEIAIDASSMIYLLKIGLLGSLAAEVRLLSTPQVIKETGWPHLPVQAVEVEDETISNDDSLVLLGERKNIPVLSEDYEILMNAKGLGLDYYNSLMMINYLLFKRRIVPEEYQEYLGRLRGCAHYSREILSQGRLVYHDILEYIETHAET